MKLRFFRLMALIGLCICLAVFASSCDLLGSSGSGGTEEDDDNLAAPDNNDCSEHIFDECVREEMYIVSKATCTEAAVYYYACRNCGAVGTETYNDPSGPNGHRMTLVSGQNSTCTEMGWKTYEQCMNCDYNLKEMIPMLEHSYTSVVTAPTCAERGFTTHTCHCGDEYIDSYTERIEHVWSMYTVKPTCEDEGYAISDCQNCDAFIKSDIKPALGHEYDEWICIRCQDLVSRGLEFTSNGDGTCYLSSIGSCTDNEVFVPAKSPAGDTVISILDLAFVGCDWVEAINISSTVERVESCSFNDCTSLNSINVNINNLYYQTLDGVLYSSDLISLVRYPIGKTLEEFIVPEGTQELCKDSFANCSSLMSICVPNTCTIIASGVFAGCDNIISITLPSMQTYLGEYFGAPTYSYHNEYVPSGLSEVQLTGGSEIADYAFYNCSQITSISLPATVQNIGDSAFMCTSITSVSLPDALSEIGKSAFYGCSGLSEIDIGRDSLLNIFGNSAFACTSISQLYIPRNVVSIQNSAFSNCSKLESVIFEDNSQLRLIGDAAFLQCTSLMSIEIPDNVTCIWQNSFAWCTSLKSISFGTESKLERIAYQAFSYCTSLVSIVIPKGVKEIEKAAFDGCSNLESVEFQSLDSYYWKVAESSTATSWKVLRDEQLLDKNNAALLLTTTYHRYWWVRG